MLSERLLLSCGTRWVSLSLIQIIPTEYDLRELLKDGVQGKYADRFQKGTNLVLLDSDVVEIFPNDEAVNEALRRGEQAVEDEPAKAGRLFQELIMLDVPALPIVASSNTYWPTSKANERKVTLNGEP